jgi:DNA repair exonuclease SbcCD ATPase subunit
MASESPRLVRSLFGYRTSGVRKILADREQVFLLVQSEAQQARAKAEKVQAELDSVRAKLHEQAELSDAMLTRARAQLESAEEALRARSEQVEAAEAGTSDLRAALVAARNELTAARTELAERDRQGDTTPPLATEELSVILEAAERGVSGIMERTRSANEAQLAQAERERKAIQSEIDRFSDWQEQVAPQVRSIQQSIERAGDRITRVPHQVQEAVGSMAEAISSVSDSLARFASLPGPLSAPEGPPHVAEHPEVRRIDVIQLDDDETGSADAVHGGDRDEPSTRTEIDDDPHSVTHSGRWKDTGGN